MDTKSLTSQITEAVCNHCKQASCDGRCDRPDKPCHSAKILTDTLDAIIQPHYQARIAALQAQLRIADGALAISVRNSQARIATLEAQLAEAKAERERILGGLEDIRCSASGEYLPGIERLMKSLKDK